MPKTAPKSPNSSASVLKTSSHKRRCWKWAKHWFCWIPRKRWGKMVSEVPKMIVLWNFATKSRLKASLAVWRNLLPSILQGGLQPGSPSRRADPGWLAVLLLLSAPSIWTRVLCLLFSAYTSQSILALNCLLKLASLPIENATVRNVSKWTWTFFEGFSSFVEVDKSMPIPCSKYLFCKNGSSSQYRHRLFSIPVLSNLFEHPTHYIQHKIKRHSQTNPPVSYQP